MYPRIRVVASLLAIPHSRQIISAVVLALAITLANIGFGWVATAEAASNQPNIIVFYIDDNSPNPDWLWSNRQRTPALAKFVDQGINFEHATAVTSLCAPARAATLTGQYAHNNGVTNNYPDYFNPRDTFAPRLQNHGFKTVLVGKFMNKLKDYVTGREDATRKYGIGWSRFDILGSGQGKFYDYPLWTRSKSIRFGVNPQDHSTRVITSRAVKHIKRTPKNQPIIEFLSIYNGHEPNTPMAQFENHPACRNVRPWQGPAYNEWNVTDKPRYIQELPRLPEKSYDLRTRCEEFMTIDWLVRKVMRALRETGRYQNTLMIFTSDNGWGMGDHRKEGKSYPYTNPVIMYMLWPAVMHGQARTVTEPVQNIDLAPTFCDIAGCKLPKADGMSLLPLIMGETDRLDRKFVFEEMPHGKDKPNRSVGIRTTLNFSEDVFWVYTRYNNGERELYNLTRDPWQLKNLAKEPGYEFVVQTMDDMTMEVVKRDKVKFSK